MDKAQPCQMLVRICHRFERRVVFGAATRLAVSDRGRRAFKAFSPGMLPVLGAIFALLVAFVAVQVWNDFDKAKLAVATEASALRAVDVFAETLPDEQRTQLSALMNRHP